MNKKIILLIILFGFIISLSGCVENSNSNSQFKGYYTQVLKKGEFYVISDTVSVGSSIHKDDIDKIEFYDSVTLYVWQNQSSYDLANDGKDIDIYTIDGKLMVEIILIDEILTNKLEE